MLSLCLGILLPSDDIEKYLANYIINRGPEGYSSFCLRLLRGIKESGQRNGIPCSLEFTSALKKTQIQIKVSHSVTESVSIDVSPSIAGSDISFRVAAALNLTSSSGFAVAVNNVFLGDKDFLMDTIAKLEETGVAANSIVLSFQKQLYLPSEPRSAPPNNFAAQQASQLLLSASCENFVLTFLLSDGRLFTVSSKRSFLLLIRRQFS